MGKSYVLKCNKCGEKYEIFLGVGFGFGGMMRKAKEDALSGEMGEEWKKYVTVHSDGEFDCDRTLYLCRCGNLTVEERMSYYEHNKNIYTSDGEKRIPDKCSEHICEECGNAMNEVSENEILLIRCRKCGEKLEKTQADICWD